MPGQAATALAVSAALATVAPAFACPAIDQDAATVVVQPADPDRRARHDFTLFASGPLDLTTCRAVPRESTGFITDTPTVSVLIDRHDTHLLTVDVHAECDTVLLANNAAGHWIYDDDGSGALDPYLWVERPLEGPHDIWIGSYDEQGCEASVTVELLPHGVPE